MAATKTINFLPEIFQTETNRKFLNATLDQLVSEPNFKRINGYIGRKFAPTYRTSDSYVPEADTTRQNYQLEPSTVVINPETDKLDFYSSYIDLISQIKYYGGNTTDHSRLFANEVYSYDGKFDFDKFINFSQYYWLPNGPDAITVSASAVPTEYTWDVTRDPVTGGYFFTSTTHSNPNLTLAYGGVYKFNIKTNTPFWIQSSLSISGYDPTRPNIYTRDVLGVTNNGASSGTVTFTIPLPDGQKRYTDMISDTVNPMVTVDFATALSYAELQGKTFASIVANFGGIDGVISSPAGKKLVFIGGDTDDASWTPATNISGETIIDPLLVVSAENRPKTWIIQVDPNTDIIDLVAYDPVVVNQAVIVKSGKTNASRNFFLDYNKVYREIPLLTAPMDTLYYQDGTYNTSVGTIKLVDPGAANIDPENDIVGKARYISPMGISLTNGLRITFDSSALAPYSNNTYYVEGVGKSINLVPETSLIVPELDNVDSADYFTIARNSMDLNAWSRSNRWFHISALRYVAEINNTDLILDQAARASRPIIEFEPNIKLFNYGRLSKKPINILDTVITDVYSQLETVGTTDNSDTETTITVGGKSVTLTHGDRVIFSNDSNPLVRNKIYTFNIVDTSENPFANVYIGIILESDDGDVVEGNNVLVTTTGKEYWYNGTSWVSAQQKTSINQAPLFDVFDEDGNSYGDTNYYVNSSFVGTKVFSYKAGTGANDTILGIPLSYRTFNNVGDIQFENNFDSDTFSYLVSPITKTKVINGGYLHVLTDINSYTESNIWTKTVEETKQYQVISHTADGVNNLFEIDLLPNPSKTVPNIKVLVNSKNIDINNFGLSKVGARYAVFVNAKLLTEGDSVDILIYSETVSSKGYYQVPENFDNNALNQNFSVLTLGQLRNHLITASLNSRVITGTVPGETNLRDINVKAQGGTILKHSAPVIYSNLFLVDSKMNFIESIKYAQREYSKVKNKILEIASKTEIDINDIPGSLDTIITSMHSVKNKTFAWYNSDMVPWGTNKTVLPEYIVLDPRIREYELSKIFDDTSLSNQSVLVYLTRSTNGVTTKILLVKGRDYVFNTGNPGITIKDSFNLNYDDIITIVEYHDTDGNYFPETPTKLGLFPKYVPEIFVDDSYANGEVTVIQGHDGSITPAFGDYRDDLLLEFERRIYNNIKQEFKHEDLYHHIPGRFRITDYTLREFDQILSTSFLNWVGNNKLDYTTNRYFQSNNPWTWNYKNLRDTVDSSLLTGTWRSIFKFYFDTDRPHTHPWEMLGFSDKPDYWDDRYGAAPYTGGNMILWTDLSVGYIHGGTRKGIDKRFARPGLFNIIPVDDSGNLRSPNEFLVLEFDSSKTNASYAVGDHGPVESAWRKSSDYPFALQIALALTKPAHYFGTLVNVDRINKDPVVDQYLVRSNNQHITPESIEVNGEETATGFVRTAGYINWISDYLKNLGVGSPQALIKTYLKNLNVQLSYKSAGFTDKSYLRILAEQGSPNSTNDSVVIPDNNYRIELFKSTPVNKIVYSGVIIERSQNGYTVSGYNLSNPYFTIVPSLSNNNSYNITAGKYTGVVYKDYQKVRVKVPYGYEYTTTQQVVEFLVGYQRQLQSLGFVFSDFNTDLSEKQDWILSAKEFLTWAQQGWQAGNIIVLSPFNTSLHVSLTNSVVDEITNTPTGTKILDPNFNVIKSNNFTVVREDNTFDLTTVSKQTIAFAELSCVQYEHVLIFDNKTSFNDVIYSPDTGNRQYRLKMIGNKTANWTGALNPPGFIYNNTTVDDWQPGVDYKKGSLVSYKSNYYVALEKIVASELFDVKYWKQIEKSSIKTGLLPNFATAAGQFENFYDVTDTPLDEVHSFYSNGLIGFRERQYLTDLAFDNEVQNRFYQGYIKEKGTKNAINALAKAQLVNISNEVNVYEEWALRVGEYGAIDSNKFVEAVLSDSQVTDNPSAVQFIGADDTPFDGITYFKPNDLHKSTLNYTPNMFSSYETSADKLTLPVAGYVNVDDIDDTIFDLSDYSSLGNIINKIGNGYTIWTAKGFEHGAEWDVYRVSETNCSVRVMEYNLDNVATVTTNTAHNLKEFDIVAIKNFDGRFDGFYQVYSLPSTTQFTIALRQNYLTLRDIISVNGNGILFKLTTSRINTPNDVDTVVPKFGWNTNDKVWVDNLDANGNWGVYNKTSPWAFSNQVLLNNSEYQQYDNFGQSIKLLTDGKTMFAGAPNGGSGRAAIFLKTASGQWVENSNFVNNSTGTSQFGKAVDASTKTFVVSAPASNSSSGYVFAYRIANDGVSINQVLTPILGAPNDQFGYSLSLSDDGQWLYVGAPGASKVYVYSWIERETEIQTVAADGLTNDFTLTDQTITDPSDVLVTGSVTFIPNVDYDIVDVLGTNKLRFYVNGVATAPIAGSILVTKRNYYKLVDTWTQSNSFGYSLKTNSTGDTIIVGEHTATNGAGVAQAGKVYVYNRIVEGFVATGFNNTFVPKRTIGDTYRVTADNLVLTEGVDYNKVGNNIQFIATPIAGTSIKIEINDFVLVQTLTSAVATDRQQMGRSIEISSSTGTIYAGAPQYSLPYYRCGVVYRFTNQGRKYGSITSKIQNPTVVVGDSIRINTVEITFVDSDVTYVANRINGANIPGVTASVTDGYLTIKSVSLTVDNKLDILPGTGTALSDLGLEVYVETQIITHPSSGVNEFFGTTLAVNDAGDTLAIGSVGAGLLSTTTFDSEETVFDAGSTNLVDTVSNSGAVYIYDLMENPYETIANPSLFAYVQQLTASTIGVNFNFGASISIKNNYITVGATNDDTITTQGGAIYTFENPTATGGWDLIRYNESRVDPESVNKIYIYNKQTKNILDRLDHYDPAKGKLLGVVQQDLDFIREEDPAVYNDGIALDNSLVANFDSTYHWTDKQVGMTWWDTSKIRFIDYEQGDLSYRSKHWGEMFPGSVVRVYEWVESLVLPSQYAGSGTPLYPDNSAYVSYTTVDTATGLYKTSYYFWVYNKTTLSASTSTRINSSATIQTILENPKDQGISYAATLASNALNLYNVKNYLTGNDIVLHVDFSPNNGTNIIHSEYQLVQENSNSIAIPARIVNKLQDSLAGLDAAGLVVPDPSLSAVNKTGIEIRPRQTMFEDRLVAVENFIKFVNNVLLQYPVVYTYDLTRLKTGEPIPAATIGEWDTSVATIAEMAYVDTSKFADGHKLLVESNAENDGLWTIHTWNAAEQTWSLKRIQSYLTSIYWDYVDWYASDFDYTIKPTYTVNRYYEIDKLSLAAGNTIKLNDNGQGVTVHYRVKSDLTLEEVGIQNGTLQLKSSLYNLASAGLAFDNDNFDTSRFDQNPNQELRQIFSAIHEDIFIKELGIEFNSLFFSLVNYIFSEQKTTDWIFKTSFVSVMHKIRELIQYPSYVKDNQTFYESYINEVKPYRTQIREYVPAYDGVDYLHTGATDFDLPPYYDTTTATFRSPTGTISSDANLLATGNFVDWNNNHKYSVTAIEVVDGGTGYTLAPNVTITGGGGVGAVATVDVNPTFGNITQVVIVNPGTGYTTTPVVTINGLGTGAVLRPVLKNVFYTLDPASSYNTVRSFNSSIKFDRVAYTANVVDWEPNTAYSANVTVGTGVGNVWLADGNLVAYNNELYLPVNADVTDEATFDSSLYQLVEHGNALVKANERVMGYYQPGIGMPGKSLATVFDGIEYPGVIVTGVPYDSFTSNVNLGANIAFYSANSSIVSTNTEVDFVALGYKLNQQITVFGSDYNNEIFGIVEVTANTMIVDTGSVTNEAVGANVTFRYIDYTHPNTVDTNISSSYLDTALGTRPEDINIDGGAYVDTFSSHAPEELIPGRIYDALDMKVFTQIYGNTEVLGYRVFYNMNGKVEYTRLAEANTTVLSSNLNLTDSNISVVDASLLPEPNPELGWPGVVFINGEKITYYVRDTDNNVLSQLRRGVDGTGAATVHVVDSLVVDSSREQVIPGTTTTKTQTFTGDGLQQSFDCTDIITTYPELVRATIDGKETNNFIVVSLYPNLIVKFDKAPLDALTVTIEAAVETTWMNLGGSLVDGTGFEGSETEEVLFLKASLSYHQTGVTQSVIVDDQGNILVDNYGNPLLT